VPVHRREVYDAIKRSQAAPGQDTDATSVADDK